MHIIILERIKIIFHIYKMKIYFWYIICEKCMKKIDITRPYLLKKNETRNLKKLKNIWKDLNDKN